MASSAKVKMLSSIEVVIGDPRQPPECPHGPALLFQRSAGGHAEALFYACSACRNRSGCHFYHQADQEFSDSKKKKWEIVAQNVLPKIDHRKLYVKLMKLLQTSSNRVYCNSCNELLSAEDAKKHSKHDIVTDVTDYQITHPSELLLPLEDSKKEAQYLFTKKSTQTMVAALKSLGCKHILCIGAPRIHEYILSECSAHMDSLLLDIDHRYHQFFGPLQFCWYNVFNNYYFNKSTGAEVVKDFLKQDSGTGVAIVIDPPFGGRVEPLAHTLQQINKQYQAFNANADTDLKVLWTYPYYMEQHILSSLPEYKMLDYKVDYDNHPLFTQGPGGRKYGSPVRIFTNISPEEFPLPKEEGYKFCKPCKRWVSEENKHCEKCSTCTSKDGQTYSHCSICKKCVKPSWVHCKTCKRCCLQDHDCSNVKKSNVCFNCGMEGHKKADCFKGATKRVLGDSKDEGISKKQKLENSKTPNKGVDIKKNKKHKNKNKKKMKNGTPMAEMRETHEEMDENETTGELQRNIQKNRASGEPVKKKKKKMKLTDKGTPMAEMSETHGEMDENETTGELLQLNIQKNRASGEPVKKKKKKIKLADEEMNIQGEDLNIEVSPKKEKKQQGKMDNTMRKKNKMKKKLSVEV